MTWIRSKWWDGSWLLAAPLVVLAPLGVQLSLNFAHALAPICLAWSHRDYRQVMLARPWKFVGVPCLLAGLAVLVAVMTLHWFPMFRPARMVLENLTWEKTAVPIVVWANLYAAWNLYHAGAQNFGVWCLYRRRGYKPGMRKYLILGGFVAATVFLGHEAIQIFGPLRVLLFVAGLLFANHWLTAIGLCGHVHAQHTGWSPAWFVVGMLILGFVASAGFFFGLRASLTAAVFVTSLRAALGMWHFLQDRWLWKFSDPQVRATIGKEVFA